ncbi:PREDICTED: uncharacterized protein LOC105367716 [Ceratosolen solmsi marchali]|uniref:Uncharacterized protein LOC105367716 n=1 Tax=Ceratosolen solmsi marchali TaxID=326594 RepID=A0AAJ6YUV5_9HYME|nr:PREDICTED: uncharacterized protein LOC105367716 [Ceratosolen solmsi marchali]
MLVESRKNQINYTTILNEACERGCRKAICCINREKIFDNFGVSSKHTDEKVTTKWQSTATVSPLTEKIRQYIRDVLQNQVNTNDPLPRYFEAEVIKWMIYEARMQQEARIAIEFEAVAERDREFLAMKQQAVGEKMSRKELREASKLEGKSTSEPRANSRLRRRDEEWKDKIYIDDAPQDGPNLYILLTGFRNPDLPADLITIGVPLRCILKLKDLQDDNNFDKSETSLIECEDTNSSCDSKVFHSHSTVLKTDTIDQLDFWNKFDESNCLDLAICPYCPPSPKIGIDKIYDNISFVLYDFHNTMQNHITYLHSMKIYEVYEPKHETFRLSSYENFMKFKPEEYILIPDIMEALLYQIEENIKKDNETDATENLNVENDEDDRPRMTSILTSKQQESPVLPEARAAAVDDASLSSVATSLSKVNSEAFARLTEKLRLLNLKYELTSQTNDPSHQPLRKLELILHGDVLGLNACRANDEVTEDSQDGRIKAQYKSKFTELKRFEVKPIVDPRINVAWRLNNENEIKNCKLHLNSIYKICARKGLNKKRTKHLLNILGLKQLIECQLTNLGLAPVGKQCSMLLEEFGEAELLSPNAFQQIVGNCFQEYECGEFIAKYFLPTDSVLLLFCDNIKQPYEILEQRVTCAIRTAVCLQDFYNYIANEESQWFEHQRKSKNTNDIFDRQRNTMISTSDRAVAEPIFRDEDFILSTSLKGCDLLKKKHRRCPNSAKSSAAIAKEKESKKKQSADPRQPLASAAILSSATGETNELLASSFDFIGYDLGVSRRVQVSNLNWTFEASDGMRVRLTREIWLLGSNKKQRMTSVRITIPEEENEGLRYQESQVDDEFTCLFHLTMANGLIVAFSRLQKHISDNKRTNELLYEIQISWPSGLIIRPVEYQDADFPFYILQYYSIKGLELDKTIKDETHRKYLHNGDVVKFFNDGSVIALRPNGTIITIMNFGNGGEKSISTSTDGTRNNLLEATVLQHEISLSCQPSCECAYSKPSPLRYKVLEPDGRHYEVYDGRVVHELNRLRTNIAEAYSVKEKLVRRADGTDMLIRSNGEMLVSFPDGTRTLCGCVVESELVHCDWSGEELIRYFGQKEPEGFVSVVTYSRAEHPNYATVSRETPSVGVCGLAMGKYGPRLRITPQGLGELSTNNKLRVEFCDAGVVLTRQSCPECHRSSSSATFHHIDRPCAPGEPNALLTFEDSTNCLMAKRDEAGFSRIEISNPVVCECKQNNRMKQRYRIFALNRNGQAYEYHRSTDCQRYWMIMAEDERSSLICSDNYSLALQMPKTILGGSKDCQLDYEIPEATPSATYRLGSESIWDEPLKSTRERPVRFLIARLFKNIVSADEESLKNVQSALVHYWREIATGSLMKDFTDKQTMTCECETDIVSQIRSIGLGKVKTIDWEIYETGRQHLKEMKVKQDEKRTGEMIDRFYYPNKLHSY